MKLLVMLVALVGAPLNSNSKTKVGLTDKEATGFQSHSIQLKLSNASLDVLGSFSLAQCSELTVETNNGQNELMIDPSRGILHFLNVRNLSTFSKFYPKTCLAH